MAKKTSKKKAVRSGRRFVNAGKRLKKLRKVKLTSKAYNTLAKREAAIKKSGGKGTSTRKGMARKSARKAYKTKIVKKGNTYWRVLSSGKKKRTTKAAYKNR